MAEQETHDLAERDTREGGSDNACRAELWFHHGDRQALVAVCEQRRGHPTNVAHKSTALMHMESTTFHGEPGDELAATSDTRFTVVHWR